MADCVILAIGPYLVPVPVPVTDMSLLTARYGSDRSQPVAGWRGGSRACAAQARDRLPSLKVIMLSQRARGGVAIGRAATMSATTRTGEPGDGPHVLPKARAIEFSWRFQPTFDLTAGKVEDQHCRWHSTANASRSPQG